MIITFHREIRAMFTEPLLCASVYSKCFYMYYLTIMQAADTIIMPSHTRKESEVQRAERACPPPPNCETQAV